MTNLRLPGQYDERLLGSVGLQGPYYNWHRWYLPGVGRYLELDPIALGGGLNGRGAPDWYNYALGNPLRYVDPDANVAVAIPPIIWGAGAAVAAWETYVAMCTAAGNCPWNAKKCDPVPPPPPGRTPCFLIGSGGKGPKPGATQRCTYSCEPPGGPPYQINEFHVNCPQVVYR